MHPPRCDQTPAWAALRQHYAEHGRHFDLRQAFAADPYRFERFAVEAPELFADLSKNLLDAPTQALLLDLAGDCQLEARRDSLFAGAAINHTEGRAVLHSALRAPRGRGELSERVNDSLERMLAYAESVRANRGIRHVVNIGIGGSDLGPQMVVSALEALALPGLSLHFVGNVDGHDLEPVLRPLKPQETLFIIASKTFTTQETLANTQAAKAWFLGNGGRDIAGHFVATTANASAAKALGIETSFEFWDWVGGRYSLWSTIGLPIALAIGAAAFRELLAGAHAMDRHFAEAPMALNLPVRLGLLDIWYRNFHGFASRSIAPYHQGLKRLPAYLQQLEMESNGKCVDLAGEPLPFATSPVIWGEPGTNGQHAYFQLLHQGTDVIPVEFILVKRPAHAWPDQHHQLLASGLAQSQALMLGKTTAQALEENPPTASPHLDPAILARHRTFPGNRPSSTLLLEALTPRALGALIALFEHRVFVSGALWGINSFDQWGVELGKALCSDLLPRLRSGALDGLDGSTAGLLARLRS